MNLYVRACTCKAWKPLEVEILQHTNGQETPLSATRLWRAFGGFLPSFLPGGSRYSAGGMKLGDLARQRTKSCLLKAFVVSWRLPCCICKLRAFSVELLRGCIKIDAVSDFAPDLRKPSSAATVCSSTSGTGFFFRCHPRLGP